MSHSNMCAAVRNHTSAHQQAAVPGTPARRYRPWSLAWIQRWFETKQLKFPCKREQKNKYSRLTLGCQFSYCFCKFAPMVSRAFWGPIDKGSVEAMKRRKFFNRHFLCCQSVPPRASSSHSSLQSHQCGLRSISQRSGELRVCPNRLPGHKNAFIKIAGTAPALLQPAGLCLHLLPFGTPPVLLSCSCPGSVVKGLGCTSIRTETLHKGVLRGQHELVFRQ